jgi:hypothetical protein
LLEVTCKFKSFIVYGFFAVEPWEMLRTMKAKYLAVIVTVVVLCSVVVADIGYSHWCSVETLPKANIEVKVVYAYLARPTVNSNAAGLTYDASPKGEGYNLTSYIVILKVTNDGDQMVSMTQFRAVVAEHITENAIGFNDTNGNPAPGGLGGPSFEISNALITDQRMATQSAGFSNYLDAGKSRLIALTGMITLDKFDQQNLRTGTLSVWGATIAQTGYASGETAWTSNSQSANDVEQVTFQQVGGDYLYNALLGTNQTLVINGLDATVVSSMSA